MILLDRPYVSKHFLNYLERSGQPVLETPFTAGLARDYGLNLVDDAEAEKRCRNGERLYLPRTRWNGFMRIWATCLWPAISTP